MTTNVEQGLLDYVTKSSARVGKCLIHVTLYSKALLGMQEGWAGELRKALERSASTSLSATVIHHSYSPLVNDNGREEINVPRKASQASRLLNSELGQQPDRLVEWGWLEQCGGWFSSPPRCRVGLRLHSVG